MSADDNTTVSAIDITTRQEDSGQKLTCRAHTPGLAAVREDTWVLDIHCKSAHTPGLAAVIEDTWVLDIHCKSAHSIHCKLAWQLS